MNIEETKEAIRVMQAFVDGKEVEYQISTGTWLVALAPSWNWPSTRYRIKTTQVLCDGGIQMSEQPINNGGPAFPTVATATTHGFYADGQPCMTHYGSRSGISVRDYFAAAALQGMLADLNTGGSDSQFAESAYAYADAMLKAREGK